VRGLKGPLTNGFGLDPTSPGGVEQCRRRATSCIGRPDV
jgi:hypothetical protein